MTGEVVALVTCPADKADGIAATLVADNLAACVNILPGVTSVYRWEGNIARDAESLLLIKTNSNLWSEFEKRVHEIHPYDIPEIICVPIEKGAKPYLDWLNASLKR